MCVPQLVIDILDCSMTGNHDTTKPGHVIAQHGEGSTST